MILLDSNIIIAAVKTEEKHHKKAKTLLECDEDFLILDMVLSEIYTILLLRTSYKHAIKTIEWIDSDSRFTIKNISDKNRQKTISFLQKNKTKLSFVDALLLVIHQSENIKLATLDKELIGQLTQSIM